MDPLKDLLRNHSFIIPENQRGFSWRTQHAEAMVNDLRLMGEKSHYMGPIIVTSSGREPFRDEVTRDYIKEFILDDGQQRLTSFILFSHAIVERFEEIGDSQNQHCIDLSNYLAFNHVGRNLRIQNRNGDLNQFLRHLILDEPAPAGRTPPMNALEEVLSYFRRVVFTLAVDDLVDWKLRITTQAKFIFVNLSLDDIDRYLAFDAINSRGLPLTEFDKIKNFCSLLSQRRPGLNLLPEQEWYAALSELEKFGASSRAAESTFISEAHSLFFEQKTGQDAVHSDFVKRFKTLLLFDDPILEKQLEDYVAFWRPFAEAFGFLFCHDRDRVSPGMATSEARQWLVRIDQMGLPTIPRPILAAALLKYGRTDFERVTRWCEIYTFRVHALAGRRTDTNKHPINSLAHQIYFKGKDINHVGSVLCGWLHDYSPLGRAVKFLCDGNAKYYFDRRMRGWSHCFYFLYQYELSVSPHGVLPIPWKARPDEQKSTIEHILPQTHRDGGWWQTHWTDNGLAESFKHRIGNLVLTNDNSALGQKSFPEKLDTSDGSYCYNHQNATNGEKRIRLFSPSGDSWRVLEILRREREMLVFAIQRWSMGCNDDTGKYQLPVEFRECLGETDAEIDFAVEDPIQVTADDITTDLEELNGELSESNGDADEPNQESVEHSAFEPI
jgi:hypothetical protein